jgi:hypothetical protein
VITFSFCGNERCAAFSDTSLNNIGDSARLFALANMAAADAIITAWDERSITTFGGLSTAIQEGDNDGNPKQSATRNGCHLFPHLLPGLHVRRKQSDGLQTRTLEHLFGDQTTFSVFSTPANTTKTYNRFSDMADDVVVVRIYQGIHFRSADEVARRQGTRAADWAISHFLRPAK